jgi:hypothetical protein
MRILCFFALLFLLFNCSPPSVSYERIIENNSSYDIWLINTNTTMNCNAFVDISFQDSILIPSNTRRIVESSSERNGSVGDYSDCPFICVDSINTMISNHDSLSLTAPLEASNANWQFTVLQPGESGSCKCELTITDADIN